MEPAIPTVNALWVAGWENRLRSSNPVSARSAMFEGKDSFGMGTADELARRNVVGIRVEQAERGFHGLECDKTGKSHEIAIEP